MLHVRGKNKLPEGKKKKPGDPRLSLTTTTKRKKKRQQMVWTPSRKSTFVSGEKKTKEGRKPRHRPRGIRQKVRRVGTWDSRRRKGSPKRKSIGRGDLQFSRTGKGIHPGKEREKQIITSEEKWEPVFLLKGLRPDEGEAFTGLLPSRRKISLGGWGQKPLGGKKKKKDPSRQ